MPPLALGNAGAAAFQIPDSSSQQVVAAFSTA
jgi:hypothetical protein